MISMRYHIVSLAAVFLALALGIVLGATKISSPLLSGLQSDNAELTSQQRRADSTENQDLADRVTADEKFAGAVGALTVRGTLPKTNVVLITTAGGRPGRPGCRAVPADSRRRNRDRTDPADERLQRPGPRRGTPLAGRHNPAHRSEAARRCHRPVPSPVACSVPCSSCRPAVRPRPARTERRRALRPDQCRLHHGDRQTRPPGSAVVILTGRRADRRLRGRPGGGAVAYLANQLAQSATGVVVAGRDRIRRARPGRSASSAVTPH